MKVKIERMRKNSKKNHLRDKQIIFIYSNLVLKIQILVIHHVQNIKKEIVKYF